MAEITFQPLYDLGSVGGPDFKVSDVVNMADTTNVARDSSPTPSPDNLSTGWTRDDNGDWVETRVENGRTVAVPQSDGTGGLSLDGGNWTDTATGDPYGVAETSWLDKLKSLMPDSVSSGAKDFFNSKFGTAFAIGALSSFMKGRADDKQMKALEEMQAAKIKADREGNRWASPTAQFMLADGRQQQPNYPKTGLLAALADQERKTA